MSSRVRMRPDSLTLLRSAILTFNYAVRIYRTFHLPYVGGAFEDAPVRLGGFRHSKDPAHSRSILTERRCSSCRNPCHVCRVGHKRVYARLQRAMGAWHNVELVT